MQADFLDAHERHWEDAESLLQLSRWANADHLYGFAAECGLKRLMFVFGMPYDNFKDRPHEQSDRVHADAAWARYESYRSGKVGMEYLLPSANPFNDWHVSDRYAHRSHFDQTRAKSHQDGARHIRGLIRKAQRDGWIT